MPVGDWRRLQAADEGEGAPDQQADNQGREVVSCAAVVFGVSVELVLVGI